MKTPWQACAFGGRLERDQLKTFEAQPFRPPPPLNEKPSEVVLEATAIIPAWTLYKLLHLDALSDVPIHMRRRAEQEATRIAIESARWLKIAARPSPIEAATGLQATLDSTPSAEYCASCDLFGHTPCFTEAQRLLSLCEWLVDRAPANTLKEPVAITLGNDAREMLPWPGRVAIDHLEGAVGERLKLVDQGHPLHPRT
jgi:hypothetical protein